MGIYTGTAGSDSITPAFVSLGVTSDPLGSRPSASADTINGLAGKDVLKGGGGDDTISAAGAGTLIRGDAGNDKITYDTLENDVGIKAYGDAGNDRMSFSYMNPDGGEGPAGQLRFYGGAGGDIIESHGTSESGLVIHAYGQAGDDRLEAFRTLTLSNVYPWEPGAEDNLYGGAGNDRYWVQDPADNAIERPREGYDTVEVYDSDYTLGANVEKLVVDPLDHGQGHRYVGNAANNDMTGSNGRDTIDGLAGRDKLQGGEGGDTLSGGAGNDRLTGGGGVDELTGGKGADIFDYDSARDSMPGSVNRDEILDFDGVGAPGGDRIDLSSIDAIAGGTDDPFTFIGTEGFTGVGQVRVARWGGQSVIQVNTPDVLDMEIVIGSHDIQPEQWTENDFIL